MDGVGRRGLGETEHDFVLGDQYRVPPVDLGASPIEFGESSDCDRESVLVDSGPVALDEIGRHDGRRYG